MMMKHVIMEGVIDRDNIVKCEEGSCSTRVEYGRKSSPPPFLLKTYMLVEAVATDEVVSWNSDGTAFVVWQPAEFARDLLPTLFKHNNFSSFVRQLNTYGFRKVATSRWEFCNDMFRKGSKHLLSQIRRRKSWPNKPPPSTVLPPAAPLPNHQHFDNDLVDEQRSNSSTSSSSGYLTSLVGENKRLKKENGVLNSELSSMKNKCMELLDLVAMCTTTDFEKQEDKEDVSDDGEGPKLFGVRLRRNRKMVIRKRDREEINGENSTNLFIMS